MTENYFFIDGSALIAQIRYVQRSDRAFRGRKLDPIQLIFYFQRALQILGSDAYKRAVFYFPKGDEKTVHEHLAVPNFKKPGLVRDISFKYCGQKIKGSAPFNKFVLEKVPKRWQSRFTKSEKGIDLEICCDALKLASAGKIERLFFLTNDDDFIPLCRTLKEFGTNISLIHLSEIITPNDSLLQEVDSYDVVSMVNLQSMFIPLPTPPAELDGKSLSSSKPLSQSV